MPASGIPASAFTRMIAPTKVAIKGRVTKRVSSPTTSSDPPTSSAIVTSQANNVGLATPSPVSIPANSSGVGQPGNPVEAGTHSHRTQAGPAQARR